MTASTTQEILFRDDRRASRGRLVRSISALSDNDFNHFIQQQYGACWGTFKFEDMLSNDSSDVSSYLLLKRIDDIYLLE